MWFEQGSSGVADEWFIYERGTRRSDALGDYDTATQLAVEMWVQEKALSQHPDHLWGLDGTGGNVQYRLRVLRDGGYKATDVLVCQNPPQYSMEAPYAPWHGYAGAAPQVAPSPVLVEGGPVLVEIERDRVEAVRAGLAEMSVTVNLAAIGLDVEDITLAVTRMMPAWQEVLAHLTVSLGTGEE